MTYVSNILIVLLARQWELFYRNWPSCQWIVGHSAANWAPWHQGGYCSFRGTNFTQRV